RGGVRHVPELRPEHDARGRRPVAAGQEELARTIETAPQVPPEAALHGGRQERLAPAAVEQEELLRALATRPRRAGEVLAQQVPAGAEGAGGPPRGEGGGGGPPAAGGRPVR